jgi:signal peptidase I
MHVGSGADAHGGRAAAGALRRNLWAAGAVLGTIVLVRTFLLQVYGIGTPSMSPTLLPGDYVVSSNLPFGAELPGTRWRFPALRAPRPGEVVVFGERTGEPRLRVIKRIVGAPGDTIRMIDGRVFRNGTEIEEGYVSDTVLEDEPLTPDGPYGIAWHAGALPAGTDTEYYSPTRRNRGPLVVPPDHYFLLGDDRDRSVDSRVTGFVERRQILGTVLRVYYSVAPDRTRPTPRIVTAARWSRIGARVN